MDPFELGWPRSVIVPIVNAAETLPELGRRLAGAFDRLDGPCKGAVRGGERRERQARRVPRSGAPLGVSLDGHAR